MQDWLRAVLAREPRTVLLVTHDVEEALLVADRVAVLSRRPGRIVLELDVDVAREGPRRSVVTQPDFVELRERVLEALE
jgi:NitT/TauT family transport system ATP-binding protein